MRGSIVKRSRWSWSLVVDQGRDASGKRRQKWTKFDVPRDKSVREAYKLAEAELAKLLGSVNDGTFVDATKVTLIEYMRDWHSKAIAPIKRPMTVKVYKNLIDHHVATAPIGLMLLQHVRASDLEGFYATRKLAPSSVGVLHAIIHRALKTAVRDRLLVANPAAAVESRPRASKDHGEGARQHCWSADEARRVLSAAKDAGQQVSAFFALAIDTGARKSELLGLTWSHVDLDAATVAIVRQLSVRESGQIGFAPTKTGKTRTVVIGPETIARLRTHRKHQRELFMANRTTYKDYDLVFAIEPQDQLTPGAELGMPCRALTTRYFDRVIKTAGVRRIKVHGLRHTSATLALSAGVPVQVVAQRLGHAQVSMTLDVYAHSLPSMQHDAAAKLSAVLAGRR